MGRVPGTWLINAERYQEPAPELRDIAQWFETAPDARDRFRWALRDSLDELLDGQRTGRWAYQHLSKTEKTYLGTAVEVNLTKEFEFTDGDHLDWKIAGRDIDCKFSKDVGGWEIPMEMYLCADHGERQGKDNHPAMLTWFDDTTNRWLAGLVTVTDDRLWWRMDKQTGRMVRGYNRDNKRKLRAETLSDIYWLWGGMQKDLPRNLLLQMDSSMRGRILTNGLSGQQRVTQLFLEAQRQIVSRQVVLTVGQQDDAPKRVRDARKPLKTQGIVVLGHQDAHPKIAKALGLPIPVKGEWISVRLVSVSETDTRPFVELYGERWAIARDEEPVIPVTVDYRYLSAPR
ncbi:restriction endonuclease [Gordonia amicalis]|nr:restriction endonuclease [Gordonia amicalis]GAC55725.1 putative type II restriction enzyme [Gordonia amicalis NBRC 100051 = JCM 11271]